jgi:hypothetical protein
MVAEGIAEKVESIPQISSTVDLLQCRDIRIERVDDRFHALRIETSIGADAAVDVPGQNANPAPH